MLLITLDVNLAKKFIFLKSYLDAHALEILFRDLLVGLFGFAKILKLIRKI